MKTLTEIKEVLRKVFENPQFYIKPNGDLTMSLDGKFVDHTWECGTWINK